MNQNIPPNPVNSPVTIQFLSSYYTSDMVLETGVQ